MLKRLLTLTVAVIMGMTSATLSQTYQCYNEEGSTVRLIVQDSIISVKVDEGVTSLGELILEDFALDPTVQPEPICEGFSLLRVRSGYDPVALVQRLRNR